MSTNLADIKVGDRVWVHEGAYGKKIQPVIRLTPTQIILGECHPQYSRFERGKPSRWNKDEPSYWQIGGTRSEHIVRLATPEECKQWDKEQAEEAERKAVRQREADACKAKRDELEALFQSDRTTVRQVHNTTVGGQHVEWSVTLYGSESDVRRWAEQLKGDNL